MYTPTLKRQHERCIELLEAIEAVQTRIWLSEESLQGFPGTFATLRKRYEKDIEIRKALINRLYDKYLKLKP